MATNDSIDNPPSKYNFAVDAVDHWAAKDPSLRAMLWVDGNGGEPRDLTYKYFSDQSKRAAQTLTNLGAKKGDRMVIVTTRIPAWWEISTGANRAGIVVMPCTTLAVAADLAFRIETGQASIFVGDEASIRKFLSVRAQCPSVRIVLQAAGAAVDDIPLYSNEMAKLHDVPDFKSPDLKISDPSIVFFTSGTTGPPKMVLHNQLTYPWSSFVNSKYWLKHDTKKLSWSISDQGWAKAAMTWFGAWNLGAAMFIEDRAGPFNSTHVCNLLHEYPITTFCAPPTVYRQMVTQSAREHLKARPAKALEHCAAAGEPLSKEVFELWKEISGGIEIKDGFGQSETVLVCSNYGDNPVKPGSMGRTTPGITLEVIDENGHVVKPGDEGDIAIEIMSESGKEVPCTFVGYLSKDGTVTRPERGTKSSARKWYPTGDRAFKDEDGYVTFVGRSDDVIKSSAYRIGPFEVEFVLNRHQAVLDSAVVSSPDESRGEVVKAFIVLTEEAKTQDQDKLAKDIQDFCKREAAPYRYPRKIQFVDATYLPRTINGKVRRAELRKGEWKDTKVGAKL